MHSSLYLSPEPSDPPQNVRGTNISSTEIMVSWEEVPAINQNGEITTYEIQYVPLETFEGQISTNTVNTSNGSVLMMVLTGLEEYVEYNISVRAYTSAGPGPYSDPVTERTSEDGKKLKCDIYRHMMINLLVFSPIDPSSPPGDVVAVSLSSTSVRVNWTEVPAIDQNGIITQYEVEYNQTQFTGVTMSNVTVVNSMIFTTVLTELLEYVEYSIRVRAYTSEGPGPYSNITLVITDEDG